MHAGEPPHATLPVLMGTGASPLMAQLLVGTPGALEAGDPQEGQLLPHTAKIPLEISGGQWPRHQRASLSLRALSYSGRCPAGQALVLISQFSAEAEPCSHGGEAVGKVMPAAGRVRAGWPSPSPAVTQQHQGSRRGSHGEHILPGGRQGLAGTRVFAGAG